mgnify:FL=1
MLKLNCIKNILKGIGKWLEVNGKAIFDTQTWDQYGEGPTKMNVSGPFSDNKDKIKYTAKDFRFTTKGNKLFAISLGWPNKNFKIQSMDKLYEGEILDVKLIGSKEKIEWKLSNEGLHITRPNRKPCDHAYCFEISRRENF